MLSVSCISYVFIFVTNTAISLDKYTLFLSLVNSITFSMATISHIQSLKFSSPSLVYPFIRLNILIVVFFIPVFFLNEKLTYFQISGIILSLMALILISSQFNKNSYYKNSRNLGLMWASIAMICGAISSISCKYAANYVNKFVFIFISYVISTIFLTIALKIINPGQTIFFLKSITSNFLQLLLEY